MRVTIAEIEFDKTVRFACDELNKYLKMIDPDCIVDRRRYNEYDESVKNVIWVGIDKSFADKMPQVENTYLDDAILVEVQGLSGVISGTNSRSVLIAAYRFLKELGCAWVRNTADGEIIPRYALTPFSVYVCEKASYRHRGVCIEGSDNSEHIREMIDWLPKAGMNAYQIQFFVPGEFFERWYHHVGNPYLEKEPVSDDDVMSMVRAIEDEIDKRGLLYHAVGHGWTSGVIGVDANGWANKTSEFPEDKKEYLAEVDGKREIFQGMPLCTNLCYSNPGAKKAIVDLVVDYCKKNRRVDYLHFWLSDGENNSCECEKCRDILPSDFYVDLLNRIDEELTCERLDTRIVFLVYCDLLWAPKKLRLNNPDRFTLMFAPIKRKYLKSIKDEDFSSDAVTPFVKNKVKLPTDIKELVSHLKHWFNCSGVRDGFDYDYHLMWDHLRDPGYVISTKILFDDMQNLDKIGLNGMISCQLTRSAFPTGLPMQLMADALWDKTCDFEEKSDEYYLAAFGDDGLRVKEYTCELSRLMNPHENSWEFKPVSETQKSNLIRAVGLMAEFEKTVEKNIKEIKDENLRRSWEYLTYHKELITKFAKALIRRAQGADMSERERLAEDLRAYLFSNEMRYHRVIDCNNYSGFYINSITYYKGEQI